MAQCVYVDSIIYHICICVCIYVGIYVCIQQYKSQIPQIIKFKIQKNRKLKYPISQYPHIPKSKQPANEIFPWCTAKPKSFYRYKIETAVYVVCCFWIHASALGREGGAEDMRMPGVIYITLFNKRIYGCVYFVSFSKPVRGTHHGKVLHVYTILYSYNHKIYI